MPETILIARRFKMPSDQHGKCIVNDLRQPSSLNFDGLRYGRNASFIAFRDVVLYAILV